MGKAYQQLDLEYLKYLEVKSSDVVKYLSNPKLRTELALPNAKLTEEAIAKVAECSNLKWLDLTGTRITAKTLAMLSQCDALRQLFLTSCPIEKSGYRYLAGFDSLEEVDFSGSSLTDQDLRVISKLPLKVIRLSQTRVTDSGVNSLTGMKTLKTLDLSRSQISAQARAMLRSAMPALNIIE